MIHDHLSLHAAARDETERGRDIAAILRGRAHTRTGVPPIYQAVRDASDLDPAAPQEVRR